jgi:hypothetical protein
VPALFTTWPSSFNASPPPPSLGATESCSGSSPTLSITRGGAGAWEQHALRHTTTRAYAAALVRRSEGDVKNAGQTRGCRRFDALRKISRECAARWGSNADKIAEEVVASALR